jgi:hypothetical protein
MEIVLEEKALVTEPFHGHSKPRKNVQHCQKFAADS